MQSAYKTPNLQPADLSCSYRSPFLVPTTASCSHTFCKECIVEAVNQTSRCPVDRRPLDVDDLQPADPVIRSLVGDLKVECVNKDAGCTKQMARDSLTRHLEEECVYAKVICPFDGCGVQLPLHELLEHQDLHRAAEMDDFDQQVSQPERESSRNQHKTISRSNGLGRIRRTRVIVDFINSLANHLNAASGSSRSCARSRSRSPPSGEFVWGSSTSSGHWRSDARASNPEPETPFVGESFRVCL
ncbi:hypothetical protein FA15DRAFT_441883 [Coprinopsis marcescibilis]|uniref:RING-type domain-containing protein n=1 Tax=Coprinopsis marcescibilis TaxID=230819 RepID=A0A5C3KTN3_COPMA|nr:hypothetical protein FA15DRAFT_441883 [Coprinopsis marcescibilis]